MLLNYVFIHAVYILQFLLYTSAFLNFRACINTRCLLKILNPNNSCPICAVQYSDSSAGTGYAAKILVEENSKYQVYTFFTQAMNSLL